MNITVYGPEGDVPDTVERVHELGADFWPLAMTRELDDLILRLRANELELGTWVIRTRGRHRGRAGVRAGDRRALRRRTGWSTRSATTSSACSSGSTSPPASLVALIEPGSCFAGALLELALACDRQYMLDGVHGGPRRGGRARPDRALGVQLRHVPDGQRPVPAGLALLRRRRRRSPSCARRPTAASTPPRRWSWAWSPTPRTTSTGRTRCGSCWRSGRRCRPTRSPAWRPTTASSARRPWRRASSAVSRRGRTGSSCGPTRPATDGALRRYGTGRKADFDRQAGVSDDVDRLLREDPEQRRPRGRPQAAAGPGELAAQLPQLVEDDGPGRAHRGRLPAHRRRRRPRGLGALRPRRRWRSTAGACSSPSATPTGASRSASRRASRSGSRCPASTAPTCSG